MKTKLESYLGFAKKSGNLLAGFSTCVAAMKKKKIKLLILSEDLAENSMEKITSLARATGTPYRVHGHSDFLGPAAGSPGRAVFGITDGEFAGAILGEIDKDRQIPDTSTEKEVQ